MLNARQVVDILLAKLREAKENGFESVTTDSVKALVEQIGKDIESEASPLAGFALQNDLKLEHFKATAAGQLELFRSVISTAIEGGKALILINGGSAVALLAFIGHVVATGNDASLVHAFARPLAAFVLGLFFAALTAAFLPFAQKFFNENRQRLAHGFSYATYVGAALSLGMFLLGSFMAYKVFATMEVVSHNGVTA